MCPLLASTHTPLTGCRALQVSTVLAALHGLGFVHLDIKPDNLLVARHQGAQGGEIYKVGDYGLASRADGSWPVDEGDRRYCSKELMAGGRGALRAADVFSLGLTVYELASGAELPNDGPVYACLRESKLPRLEGYSLDLQDLVQVRHRSTCTRMLHHMSDALGPVGLATRAPPLGQVTTPVLTVSSGLAGGLAPW